VLLGGDSDTVEVYHLATDPLQSRNLAASEPQRVREAKLRIAAWIQNQTEMMQTFPTISVSNR
jgi:hypothetical protein